LTEGRTGPTLRPVTDIGVPDPLEPEIDVIPAVDPVPGPVPIPEPTQVPERRRDRTSA
jgi:hypothetical protein